MLQRLMAVHCFYYIPYYLTTERTIYMTRKSTYSKALAIYKTKQEMIHTDRTTYTLCFYIKISYIIF